MDSSTTHFRSSTLPRLPRHLIDRRVLLERLDERHPLTILRAPVGYGKTTLLTDWAARRRQPDVEVVHWITAGGGPDRLWNQIQRSFDRAAITPTASSDGDPRGPVPGSGSALVEQAVDRHGDNRLLVVDELDDADTDVDRRLLDLVRRSRRTRLAVILRDPDRFRRGDRIDIDTLELAAHDLAFTADETWTLARCLDSGLTEEVAHAIHLDVAGWPALTRAALLTLAEAPATERSLGSARRATSEFLSRHLPSPQFPGEPTVETLALSVPEALSPDIVAALQVPDAHEAFRAATAHGLLQPDVADQRLLRWPAALRRLLSQKLADEHPHLLGELHLRLADHFDAHRLPDDALRHALAAEEWAKVVSIVDHSWGMLFNGDRAQLRTALSRVPASLLRGRPRVRVTKALVLALPDDDVLKLVGPQLRAPATTHDAIETDVTMMVATRVRGLWATAAQFADRLATTAVEAQRSGVDRAVRRLPIRMLQVGITRMLVGDLAGSVPPMQLAYRESAVCDRRYSGADAASKLACALAVRGELSGAGHWLEQFRRHDVSFGWITPLIRTTALVAQIIRSTAMLDRAAAEQSVNELLTTPENQEFWGFRLSSLIRFALSNGSPDWGWRQLVAARDRFGFGRAEGQLMPVAGGYAAVMLLADEANLLLAMERATRARAVLRDAPEHHLLHAPRGRLFLLSNDSAAAIDQCNRGLSDPATPVGQLSELLLIRSLARNRAGDIEGAITDLRRATNAIHADGNLYALCTVPRNELAMLATRLPSAEALLASPQFQASQDHYPEAVDVVELTERESLLLQLLDEGASLQVISRKLFVSVNTLKTQRRTLYSKLGASSRMEALIRARDWGLLESAERPTG